MKDVNCVGIGYTSEEVPAFVFEVEMHRGRDFDGKFDIAFALADIDGEKQFVVLQDTKENIVAQVKPEDSLDIINELLDKRAYVTMINYDNADYEIGGSLAVPMLGRVLGKQYDYVDRTALPSGHCIKLKDMKEVLEEEGFE